MLKRAFLFLSVITFIVFVADTGYSQPRAAAVALIAPALDTVQPDVNIQFQWEAVQAARYKIILQRSGRPQRIGLNLSASSCTDACTYTFAASVHDWDWFEGGSYSWWVKAFGVAGELAAKSVKSRFIFNSLPESIALIAPAADAAEPDGLVDFSWAADANIDKYRLVISDPDGLTHKSPWLSRASICAVECTYSYGFGGVSDGITKWKVQGHASDVTGQTSSAKRSFVLSTVLDASDFPPPDLNHPQAAFIFSYDFAIAQGATAEWRKMEGVVIDTENRRLYMALSRVTQGMTDSTGDIQLASNPCGVVLGGDLDESWLVSELTPVIVGGPYDPTTEMCAEDNISEPDNLFVDANGDLWIGEDSSHHVNNMLWKYEVGTGQLKRFATVPLDAELTGLHISGNTLFMNVQHPSPVSLAPFTMGTVGVITGFAPTDDFVSVPVPEGVSQNTLVIAAGEYQVLGRAGDLIPGTPSLFGAVVSLSGVPLDMPLCNNPDGNMFLPSNPARTEGILYTNWECRPGGVSRLVLSQGVDGLWTVISGSAVDFAAIRGTTNNCNASVTPWNTGLSSEESAALTGEGWFESSAPVMNAYVGGTANPYDYGYNIELIPTADGGTTAIKHYAMGRRENEQSWVAPDLRTVYFGDDGLDKIFYRFVANNPGDLGAGTLYAARVIQTTGNGVSDFRFQLEWLRLGSGNNTEIEAAIRALYPPQ